MKKILKDTRGSVASPILYCMIFIMFALPILFLTFDKYIMVQKVNETKTGVETALYSSVESMQIERWSYEHYDFNSVQFLDVFNDYLKLNTKEGECIIKDIKYIGSSNLPYTDPINGETYNYPYFKVSMDVKIHFTLYGRLIGHESAWYPYYENVLLPVDN